MNYDIAKRIRRLRLEAGMKQEELAEKLYVTRQAVSAWENGKTAVSLEYLTAYSEFFGVSTDELIYGKKPGDELYEPYQKKYKLCCMICGAVLALCVVLHFTLWPWVNELAVNHFVVLPRVLYTFIVHGAVGICIGMLLPSIMSLKADIRLGVRGRRTAAIAAAVLVLAYVWCILSMFTGFGLILPIYRLVLNYIKLMMYLQPFAAALSGFLAVNK